MEKNRFQLYSLQSTAEFGIHFSSPYVALSPIVVISFIYIVYIYFINSECTTNNFVFFFFGLVSSRHIWHM